MLIPALFPICRGGVFTSTPGQIFFKEKPVSLRFALLMAEIYFFLITRLTYLFPSTTDSMSNSLNSYVNRRLCLSLVGDPISNQPFRKLTVL